MVEIVVEFTRAELDALGIKNPDLANDAIRKLLGLPVVPMAWRVDSAAADVEPGEVQVARDEG